MKEIPQELKGLNLDNLTIRIIENGKTRDVKGYYYAGRRCDIGKPKGYNVYDLRESDDDGGDIASIKDFILVNHFGTFLTKELINCATDELKVVWWSWDPE